jgi:hypothetical protein
MVDNAAISGILKAEGAPKKEGNNEQSNNFWRFPRFVPADATKYHLGY